MTSPNVGATAQSVSDKLDGIGATGPLSYREVDQLAPMAIFGLASSAPYPEAPSQTTTSVLDVTTTLGKIHTATYQASDGNTYNEFDALMTILEWVLAQKKAAD